jgi:large subunit ribosomal protein L4
MPKIDVYNVSGEVVGNIDLKEEIFGINPNKEAMHIAVVNQLANRRQGTQSTKTKSEVSGGGIKPWRQKGTGRARQGSIRSAQWIKGGIVLGPKPRSYRYTIPKKLKRLALKSALSSKVSENDMLVLDSLTMDSFKTKQIVGLLSNLKVEDSALIVIAGKDDKIENSARNIPGVKTALVKQINVFDILKYNNSL